MLSLTVVDSGEEMVRIGTRNMNMIMMELRNGRIVRTLQC
jgi:hypothetical protein